MPSQSPSSQTDLAQQAVRLAAEILIASRDHESRVEKKRSAMMGRMISDSSGKKLTIAMADQVVRIRQPARAAERLNGLVREHGVPPYLTFIDRFLFRSANIFARLLPGWIMPLINSRIRQESGHVIISASPQRFSKFLADHQRDGFRVNVNQLGEAVLGERESTKRFHEYLDRLNRPDVDYVSVKLSSIISQISLTGYQQTLDLIRPRLQALYRAAIKAGDSEGAKFINLDMEEYRDLHLTVDAFCAVLGEPEFDDLEAGIVLQAYLPDSFEVLKNLTQWAIARKQRTGTGIKVRLVKGANLAMEQVEASLRDWPQAPYPTKLESDANYKRMLQYACQQENAAAVRIGVGSHNLFDIAYAMLLRDQRGVSDRVEFEMLEGMADAQAAEVLNRTGGCLTYSPVVNDADFASAIAYLVRRLDENTAPGGFLGAMFTLETGSQAWDEQQNAFLAACRLASDSSLSSEPNRTQNRLQDIPQIQTEKFENVADTDFSLPANRDWANQIIARWKEIKLDPVPLQVGGQFLMTQTIGQGSDPSRPDYNAYQFSQASLSEVEEAIQAAVVAAESWERVELSERGGLLRQSAIEIEKQRGETIGSMLLDAGKNITEADTEISEAIDFANYYSRCLDNSSWHDGTTGTSVGVVVVTPPWNFPFAIPAGGVLAALAAGNSVILKPARESVLVAWQLVQQLWAAGIPRDVLQFLPTADGSVGKSLVSDSRIGAVILTGSTFTAQLFQSWRPDMKLFAETSGKNALIITATADLDLAVKDLVHGAFGHAGQKCSATSIALIEKSVYQDPRFLQQLKDAAESLHVAGSWDPSAVVTPVIREPDDDLLRGLTQLDEGESWLVKPEMVGDNRCHWTPGIRLGVRPGSWYHRTECFGPVLGLICCDDLQQAIEIQNSSDFGLTGGIHALDPQEIELWREQVAVGNAYVNRTTTGAIVQRQPFGGWKKSCIGPGAKAGGPNYVAALRNWTQSGLPELIAQPSHPVNELVKRLSARLSDETVCVRLNAAAGSYAYWWQREFSQSHDPSRLHGETNEFRYRHRIKHLLRIEDPGSADALELVALVWLACRTVGTQLHVSSPATVSWFSKWESESDLQIVVETETELSQRFSQFENGTLRFQVRPKNEAFAAAVANNLPVVQSEVLLNGRLELLNYLQEQSISETVHRYGNLNID